MKKLFLGILFIMIVSKADAENLFTVGWNFGNIGFGINYSSENDNAIEFAVSVFSLTIEQRDLNIGFEFNPIKYWHLFELQNEPETKYNGEKFSFINASLYWDLIENYSVILGPFASINYLYVNTLTGISTNEYIFSSGLRFSYKLKEYKIFKNNNSQIFGVEIGYRNIMGKNNLYFSINADVILALAGIGYGMAYDKK